MHLGNFLNLLNSVLGNALYIIYNRKQLAFQGKIFIRDIYFFIHINSLMHALHQTIIFENTYNTSSIRIFSFEGYCILS